MEKLYTCVACSNRFRVLSRPDRRLHKQHEVEINVECPVCFKTNSIVWPQGESLPLVLTEDGQPSQRLRGIEIQILRTAKQLIAERLGVIAASRRLSGFRQFVEPPIAEVLSTFAGIDSETDTLPIGGVRKRWNREVLKQKDKEITEAERIYRDSAMNAAEELIRLLEKSS